MLLRRKEQLALFFFFNDTATTEIYTLSLHDALPICRSVSSLVSPGPRVPIPPPRRDIAAPWPVKRRSEEHTSELQSQSNLVCRLLLEKKKRDDLHQRFHNLLPIDRVHHRAPQLPVSS